MTYNVFGGTLNLAESIFISRNHHGDTSLKTKLQGRSKPHVLG